MGGALIAAASALFVFWLTAFVGEDYRRSRDAKALAAALAGEVDSFLIAMKIAEAATTKLLELLANNAVLPKRTIPDAPETVYAANLKRIGLLGVSIGRDLPFAYHMMYAYRVASMQWMCTDNPIGQKAALDVALKMIENAKDVLPGLLTKLEKRANARWYPFRY